MRTSAYAYGMIVSAALLGCGAEPVAEDEELAEAGEGLPPGGKADHPGGGFGKTVCDILDALPNLSFGGIGIANPSCTRTDYHDLFYLGSDSRLLGRQSSSRAQATSEALYCALKEAHGAVADGTSHTPLGRFGMESRLEISSADPRARRVEGQRLGRLYAFGVGVDLDNQDFRAAFPTERSSTRFLRRTGHYMDVETRTTKWRVGGSVAAPPFTFSLDLEQRPFYEVLGNGAVALSPLVPAGDDRGRHDYREAFRWQTFVDRCNECRAASLAFCDCPTEADWAGHNRFAGWVDAQYRNLQDAVLPFFGAAGVSGDHVYKTPGVNWFQLGRPDGAGHPGEPSHRGDPSTRFGFGFGVTFEIVEVKLQLGVGFRSGMELQKFPSGGLDTGTAAPRSNVVTSLDAESDLDLDAHLIVRNPFPFGPDILLDADIPLLHPEPATGHAVASAMQYDEASGLPFTGYATAAGPQFDAQGARDVCLSAPPVSLPRTEPGSPKDFVDRVREEAGKKLFPCDVRLCRPRDDGNLAARGTRQLCDWNQATRRLDCRDTGESCEMCDQHAALCDEQGNLYSPSRRVTTIPCTIR